MVGSTQSTAGPTFVLNTIVADELMEIADELEKAGDVTTCAQGILKRIANDHSRVIYNGDNYSEKWVKEAEKRKLPNICSTVDSLKTIMDEENVSVFERQNVLSKTELHARTEILLEAYSMQINIEALTMLNMVKRQILPACVEYSCRLADAVKSIGSAGVSTDTQKAMLEKLCGLISCLDGGVKKLEEAIGKAGEIDHVSEKAEYYKKVVIEAMSGVRQVADELETIVDAELWPLPTYAEMLFLK
jgi:glutamine synthetase